MMALLDFQFPTAIRVFHISVQKVLVACYNTEVLYHDGDMRCAILVELECIVYLMFVYSPAGPQAEVLK